MMQLIHYFQSRNYTITFASPCAKSERAFDLATIGIDQVPIELNHPSFDTFIKTLDPHIVVFDRFMMEEQFGWRVMEQCPNAMRILDTEDLHCLRKGREQAFKEGKPFDKTYLFNDTAKREIASIYRCDLSLIISESEMDVLKHQFKVDENLLLYLPFMLEPFSKEHIQNLSNFDDRQHFMTIGNFFHWPNYNSVIYLKDTIWPLIKKQLPKAELNIYGAYSPKKVIQLQNEEEGFLVKGFAEDVNTVMQNSKVCLVPLRFGAGLKGKLIDAMRNGTPCVTTSIGAEGLFGNMDSNGFIEDTPEAFADRAVELYTNKTLWKKKQQNGFQVLNKRFGKKISYEKLDTVIGEAEKQLRKKRSDNFTGQMLWHHTLQSTKYMGRWIEEKSKKSNSL
jgi:glycosyltransferase involved in cell wall biosynthesis